MYHKHHTRGIVVSGRSVSDSDKQINIFTESFGMISARVRGARVVRSKLRSGSQDFSSGEFSLVHGKSGWKVVSVRADQNFFEIFRQNPLKLKIVGNFFNLIKKLASEEEANPTLFEIISNFLKFLTTAAEKDVALAECLTLMRVLRSLGYVRHDPELVIPMSSSEIRIKDLETIAPHRIKIIELINESLKAT